jgi:endo-alpha-1,4-polygalactosaminidase (GH114 family)
MPIDRYALQYRNVDPSQIIAADLDLFITEGGPGTDFAASAISPDALSRIQHAGTRVIARVDAAATGDSQPYWDPDWTHDGSATGETPGYAPAWLRDQPHDDFGPTADFTDPRWQALVIAQAAGLVRSGFDGVFLDGLAQYVVRRVNGLSVAEQATAMMAFAIAIDLAIRDVNADAMLVVNGSPFIVTDAVGGANSPTSIRFLEAIDGMLLEGVTGDGEAQAGAIRQAQAFILPYTDVLALDHGGSAAENAEFEAMAREQGFVPFSAFDASYSAFGELAADADGDAGNPFAPMSSALLDLLDGGLDDAFTVDADGLPIELAQNDDDGALPTDGDVLL